MKRLTGFDGVRALACLMVILHHICQHIKVDVLSPLAASLVDLGIYGNLGVSIFFVLSGALLAYPFWMKYFSGEELPSAKTYTLRRFARIAPGFYLSLTVSLVLAFILFKTPFNLQTLIRYISGLFFVADFHYVTFFPVDNNGPLWSIGFEVTSYLILYFLMAAFFRIFTKRAKAAVFAFAAGSILLTLGVHYLFLRYYPIPKVDDVWQFGIIGLAMIWMPGFNPISLFSHFLLGVIGSSLLAFLVYKKQEKHPLFDAGFLLVLVSLIVYIANYELPEWSTYEIFMRIPYFWPIFPLAIALILVTLNFSKYAGAIIDNAFFRFTAKISFGLYIWHFLIMKVLNVTILPKYTQRGGDDVVQFVIGSLITLVLSFVLASLSFYFIEKPALDWVHSKTKK